MTIMNKDKYTKKGIERAAAEWCAKNGNRKPDVSHGGDSVGAHITLVPASFITYLSGAGKANIRGVMFGSLKPSGFYRFVISLN